MSMLAETRQRKRYTLVPRGKALYEDENRFGTKMLKMMGWKKGQGLGPKEDGSKDFVRVRYKNDALGLGFEERDDQWMEHEQSFNSLLKTLISEENEDCIEKQNGNQSGDERPHRVGFGCQEKNFSKTKLKEKISGVSLEERSKQSRARVHYKKFTKGKDLTQYSEKDLANIFGKKANDEQQSANDVFQHLNNYFGKGFKGSEGDPLLNTGISVNYFIKKVEANKSRKDGDINENSKDEKLASNQVQLEENGTKKKKKRKDHDKEEQSKNEAKKDSNTKMIYSHVSVNDYFKMKMEAIKNKKNAFNTEETIVNKENSCDEVLKEEMVTKKKNKKDLKDQQNDCLLEPVKKKGKKNKYNADQENGTSKKIMKKEKKSIKLVVETEVSFDETRNKKKTDKSKIQTDSANEISTKNKYNNSSEGSTLSNTIDLTAEEDSKQESTKKKQKKNKSEEKIELDNNDKGALADDFKSQLGLEGKKKSKRNKESEKNSVDKDNQTQKASKEPAKKPRKAKRKDVNSSAKNVFKIDANLQVLNLEEIQKKYKSYNMYPISSFCAEKFRNIKVDDFKGSILPQIEGYGLGSDLQLDVQINKNDEERITNLWKCVLNKYDQLEKPKKTYQHYVREVIKARKTKQKIPKLYVKTWKRKNAFQAL